MASLVNMDFSIAKTLGGRGVEKGKWGQVAKKEKGWEVLLSMGTVATQQKR